MKAVVYGGNIGARLLLAPNLARIIPDAAQILFRARSEIEAPGHDLSLLLFRIQTAFLQGAG